VYQTCIFCNAALGRNDALENFQVGRRLAYDPDKGRLWVVCESCERWNLTPIATRWEAIEEAEGRFRGTKLRVSTDNIALAQLREGLELVRIGKPPPLEFAAWRYGDQFGRRRRRHMFVGAATLLGSSAGMIGLLPGTVGALMAAMLVNQGIAFATVFHNSRVTKVIVRDDTGAAIKLTRRNILEATLLPALHSSGFRLELPVSEPVARASQPQIERKPGVYYPLASMQLGDNAARRALAAILPWLNRQGGGKKRVRDAVDVVESAPSFDQLLRTATNMGENRYITGEYNTIARLPPRMRLALEMAVHADDERRAMDGELAELEKRWREADEIAGIADGLFLPHGVETRLVELKERSR
jgi:hypothetical protein